MQHHNAMSTLFRLPSRLLVGFILTLPASGREHLSAHVTSDAPIQTCDTVTPARTGQPGVTYTGSLRNDDYRFSATVPDSLTGLGNAPGAPFHGFAVFINNSACFLFLIGHRVTLPEDVPTMSGSQGVAVRVGGRKGIRTTRVGTSHGTRMINETVLVELPRAGYTNDVSIIFVTPLDQQEKTEPVFRLFLASLKFW
jgi:hypothetical protein